MDDTRRWSRGIALIVPLIVVALLIPVVTNMLSRDGRSTGAAPEAAGSQQPAVATPSAGAGPSPIVVATDGDVTGDGTAGRPLRSVQHAVERAEPGQTIHVQPGTYRETVRTVRSGRPGAPITIRGSDAVIAGDDDVNHLVEITHDHIVVRDLEVRTASTLIWASGVSNVRILDNTLHDAEGECVRFRYQSVGNVVAGNTITECGTEDFDLDDDAKNGEGIYIGTAPEQLDDNPTDEPDESNANEVRDNRIDVPAECVDVKEHARANVIADNMCTGSQDPDGAGFSSRGIGTVLQGNRSSGHAGSGIRLGGDSDSDGIDSVVRDNVLRDNDGLGLRVAAEPQRLLCGNVISGNGEGPDDLEEASAARPCSG